MPLDRQKIARNESDAPEDIREFVARMWIQEDKVSDKFRLQRDSSHNAKRRAVDLRL